MVILTIDSINRCSEMSRIAGLRARESHVHVSTMYTEGDTHAEALVKVEAAPTVETPELELKRSMVHHSKSPSQFQKEISLILRIVSRLEFSCLSCGERACYVTEHRPDFIFGRSLFLPHEIDGNNASLV